MAPKRILMVVTSHDRIDDEHPTGVWFEEFAVPYAAFRKAGYEVVVASPRGGPAPIDPRSLEEVEENEETAAARAALADTRPLGPELRAEDFAAIVFPGGHGAVFDLPGHPEVQRLLREFDEAGKVIAAICHGPACLVEALGANGRPLVAGRRLTCFSDEEERAVQLEQKVPFLLESRLRELGAAWEGAAPWQSSVVVDGNLITGQNPASSAAFARAVLERLEAAD